MKIQRKIVLFIACSLDGYIARANGDIDWLFDDQDYGYAKFYESIDTVLVGRKTYEQASSFEEFPFKGKDCYVFSRSANNEDEIVKFVDGDIVNFTEELKSKEGKDIWLVGGAEIIEVLLSANLIDTFIISIHPILLGNGIPLFKKQEVETKLVLKNSVKFSSGLVQLHYEKS